MFANASAALIWTLILGLSAYGWGHWLQKLTGPRLPGLLPCVTGLAIMLFFGGIANLTRVATLLPLTVFLLCGLVAWAMHMVELRRRNSPMGARTFASRLHAVLPFATAIILTGLAAAFVANPSIYNIHDDLEKYLRYPVRMLASGTVRSSPFDAIGTESLGGLAFVQAYATGYLSVFFANTADAVFGLFLTMAAAASIAGRDRPRPLLANLASLAVFVVNPLCVNVSALYLTAALTALVLFLSLTEAKPEPGRTLLLALSYASLIALKTTSLPFVACHFFLYSITVPGTLRDRIHHGLRLSAFVLAALAPWILTHYGTAYSISSVMESLTETVGERRFAGGMTSPFTPRPLMYGLGNSMLHFSLLCAAATALLAWHTAVTPKTGPRAARIIRWLALPVSYFGLVALAKWSVEPWNSVRYAAPTMIGAIAVLIGMTVTVTRAERRSLRIGTWIARAALIGALGPFALPMIRRETQAWETGAKIQMPWLARDPGLQHFCNFVRSPDASTKVRVVQDAIPARAGIAVWTQFSFLFDSRRNPIVDIDPAGLLSPEAVSEFKHAGSYVGAIAESGAQFLIVQLGGGSRTPEAVEAVARQSRPRDRASGYALLTLLREIQGLANGGATVYEDDFLTVLRISPADSAALATHVDARGARR